MRAWCERHKPSLPGTWVRKGSTGFFEELSLGPDGDLDSWLHHRPEISGGSWALDGCQLVLKSEAGLSVEWTVIDVTSSGLRVLEDHLGGVAVYRRMDR
jgi:hypothetical protein